MRLHGKLMLAALGALASTAAQASDKRDFGACDGRAHPGKADDGMRGEASQPGYSSFLLSRGLGGQTSDIAACDRALASPRLLPTQSLRRAHLLRARAAAQLRAGDAARALADLDLAEAATADRAGDPFHKRSMGVSITLLRALARAQSEDTAAATALARQAMAARPYSLQVQQVAATVLQSARAAGAAGSASPSPWLAVGRLAPEAATTALIKEAEIGNFAGVLALRNAANLSWPTERLKPMSLAMRDPASEQLLSALLVSLHTAYARAATGDPAGARRELAEVRMHVAATRPEPKPAKGAMAALVPATADAIDKYVELRARQIEARIAVAEGRPSEAIAAMVAAPLPRDAATVELLKALKGAVPAQDAALVPDIAAFEKAAVESERESLTAAISNALIAPETPRVVVDYEKARPNILGALVGGALSMGTSLLGGIDRLDGFRSTVKPDGTTKVEFVGNTPSAALVQEMTLLRAAEVARAAGKPAFVIVERKDFARRMTTSRGGVPISSVATGFKTELTIRYVEAGAEPERALDATAVIDQLGPLYYQDARAKS